MAAFFPPFQRARNTFFAYAVLAACILFPLWRPIGLGLILGYFTEGAVGFLARRFRLGSWATMFTAGGVIAAVLLVFLVPLGLGLYKAGSELIQALRDANGDLHLSEKPFVDSFVLWLNERLARRHLALPDSIVTEAGPRIRQAGLAAAMAALTWLRGLLTSTPRGMLNGLVAVVTWWLSAVEGRPGRDRLLRWLLPWERPRQLLSTSVDAVLRGLIVANLAVAGIQAAVCMGSLAIFHVPHWFALGVLCFFLAFVPVVGTALVTVGSAAWLISNGRIGAGVIMLAVALFAGTIDNLLRPFFLRGQLELPVAWIFLSIVGGLAGFGVAGVVLGPIALAVCYAALKDLEDEDRKKSLPAD